MKAYRDRARAERRSERVEIVAPDSAHAAFDKAAALLDMDLVRVPVGPDYRADVPSIRRALSRRTARIIPALSRSVVLRETSRFRRKSIRGQ